MNNTYGSSGSFGSRVRSRSIGCNTYTGRRIIFHSRLTTIHGLVNKSEFDFFTREVTSVGYQK